MSKLKKVKAKAIKVKQGEYNEVVRGKLRDKIHRQKEYRAAFLNRIMHQEELKEMQKQIEGHDKEGHKILMQWEGMDCPVDILKAKFNMHRETYKNYLVAENVFHKALQQDGLSDKDIEEVLNGSYKKDTEELVESELEEHKQNSDKQGYIG